MNTTPVTTLVAEGWDLANRCFGKKLAQLHITRRLICTLTKAAADAESCSPALYDLEALATRDRLNGWFDARATRDPVSFGTECTALRGRTAINKEGGCAQVLSLGSSIEFLSHLRTSSALLKSQHPSSFFL